MTLGIDAVAAERTQRIYARLAGFLFLWLIVNAIGGILIFYRIGASGTFAQTAQRIASSERLYRVALSSGGIETLSAVLLAFALYVTLKPVNNFLAQLAMIFILEDSILGWVVRICGFVRLHLYTSSPIPKQMPPTLSAAPARLRIRSSRPEPERSHRRR